MMTKLLPFRLKPVFSPRVWGREHLRPWYPDVFDERVGEAWLTSSDCVIETGSHQRLTLDQLAEQQREDLLGPTGEYPLLVKLLFPNEKLSIQVHPDDSDVARLGGTARAKTECWYVLESQPNAAIYLGLEPGLTMDDVKAALGQPAFESMLHREPVAEGDMIFVEAGTVHGIGPGLVLLETQQPSDTTFRLYDYGRPRELHFEAGMKVIKLHTRSGKVQPKPANGMTELISEQHFIVDRFEQTSGEREFATDGRAECIIPLTQGGVLRCDDALLELVPWHAAIVPACAERYSVTGPCKLIRARVPAPAI